MKRNLKALGLVLVAVFATVAVLASGAQALTVTPGASPAWLTAEVIEHSNIGKTERITLAGGQHLTCEEIRATATVRKGDTSITFVPSFKKCSVTIGTEPHLATVTFNDCDFFLHGGQTASPGSPTFIEGQVDLVCPTGKEMEIHVYKHAADETEELCTYKIAPFENKVANEFHNVAEPINHMTVTTTMTGITITRTGSLLCGAASTTGTLTGSTTIKAFEDKGGSISNGTVSELLEGNQTSLTISD